MKTKAIHVLSLVAAASATVFGDVYEWKSAEKPTSLGDGAIVAEWNGDAVSKLSKTRVAKDAAVTLSGDTLSLASDAVVSSFGSGTFTLALPIVCSGDFRLGDVGTVAWDGGTSNLLSKVRVKKTFMNMPLADWTPGRCEFAKGYESFEKDSSSCYHWPSNNCIVAVYGEGRPYHVVRGEGSLDVQFQQVDGVYTKCVKVRFTQNGDDLDGVILYARYVNGTTSLGMDFDDAGLDYNVADDLPWTAGGYYGFDVNYVEMIPEARPSVKVAGNVAAGGVVTLDQNTDVAFSGDHALSDSGTWGGSLFVNDEVTFEDREEGAWNLAQPIRGAKDTKVSFGHSAGHGQLVTPGATLCVTGNAIYTSSKYGDCERIPYENWQTVTNVPGLAIGGCRILRGAMHGDFPVVENATMHFVSNSADTAFYQFQAYDGGWLKASDVMLRVSEFGELQLKVLRGIYAAWSQVPGTTAEEKMSQPIDLEFCATHGGCNTINATFARQYAMRDVTVQWDEFGRTINQHVTLSAANAIPRGVMEFSGSAAGHATIVDVTHKYAFPTNGNVNVRAGALVKLGLSGLGGSGYGDGNFTYNVYPGGELRQLVDNVINMNQRVNLLGGTMSFLHGKSGGHDSNDYLNNVSLQDGARVQGNGFPRVAYTRTAKWTFAGGAECEVAQSVILMGGLSNAESVFEIGGGGNGVFRGDFMSGSDIGYGVLTNCAVEMRGTGTIRQLGVNNAQGPVRLYSGTWQLEGENRFPASKDVKLLGGTLKLAANASQALDVLEVGGGVASGLALESGAAFTLPALGIALGEGASLAVTLAEGARLRVGTSKSALDAATLARIVVNGSWRARLDDNGYLLPRTFGTAVIVR